MRIKLLLLSYMLIGLLLITGCTKDITKNSGTEQLQNETEDATENEAIVDSATAINDKPLYTKEVMERITVDDLPNSVKKSIQIKIGDDFDFYTFECQILPYLGIDYISVEDTYRLLQKINGAYSIYDLSDAKENIFDVARQQIKIPLKKIESLEEIVFEYKVADTGFDLVQSSNVPEVKPWTTYLNQFGTSYISDGNTVYLPIMIMNYAFWGTEFVLYHDKSDYYLELSENGYYTLQDFPDNQNEPSLEMRLFTVNYLVQYLRNYYPYYLIRRTNIERLYTKIKEDIVNDDYETYMSHLNQMIDYLKDGHTSVIDVKVKNNPFDSLYVTEYYPSLWDDYYDTMYDEMPGKFANSYKRVINKDIGYIYYQDFTDNEFINDLPRMLTQLSQTKGIILDLRYNEGGYIQNIFKLLEPFATETVTIDMKQRLFGKSTATTQFILKKQSSNLIDKPVILLINEYTYSAANMFAGIFKSNQLGMIIGEKSGGGGSYRADMILPDQTTLTVSAYDYILLDDGTHLNELGVEPDIKSIDEFENGEDQTLNEAITKMQELIAD